MVADASQAAGRADAPRRYPPHTPKAAAIRCCMCTLNLLDHSQSNALAPAILLPSFTSNVELSLSHSHTRVTLSGAGYTSGDAGALGAALLGGGVLSSGLIGAALDHTRRYKEFFRGGIALSVLTVSLCLFCLCSASSCRVILAACWAPFSGCVVSWVFASADANPCRRLARCAWCGPPSTALAGRCLSALCCPAVSIGHA